MSHISLRFPRINVIFRTFVFVFSGLFESIDLLSHILMEGQVNYNFVIANIKTKLQCPDTVLSIFMHQKNIGILSVLVSCILL